MTARLPAVLAERYDRYAVNGDSALAPGGAEAGLAAAVAARR